MLPYAPTDGVAHVGACAAVGWELRERGHEVVFGYGGSSPELLEREGFRVEPVAEVSPDREWHPDGKYQSASELRRLVDSQLELIGRVRPAAAVTSSGTAPRLACEVAGLPQLHLMHYLPLSPYGQVPSVVWGRRWRDARRPRRLVRATRARLRRRRRSRRRSAAGVLDEVRGGLGLAPPGAGSHGHCQDSMVAITSTPMLDPARGLPSQWRYVGPVTWSFRADSDTQDVPTERIAGDGPLVYVTQGSTGSAELLRRAVAELAEEPIEVLATTARLMEPVDLERCAPKVIAERFLPGRACLEAADLAIISGGHLTSVEALVTGTPAVVLPFRGDQFVNASRVERLGVGTAVWPNASRPGDIRAAVRRALRRSRYRLRALEIADRLGDGSWDGARNAAAMVEGLMR